MKKIIRLLLYVVMGLTAPALFAAGVGVSGSGVGGVPSLLTPKKVTILSSPGISARFEAFSRSSSTFTVNNPVAILSLGIVQPDGSQDMRWGVRKTPTVEADADAGYVGSDFQIESFGGAFGSGHIAYPFKIVRSTGDVELGEAVGVGGKLVVHRGTAGTRGDIQAGGNLTAVAGTFSGTLSSTKTCAAGYTRQIPNYCTASPGAFNNVALTRDVCTSIALPSADTKMIVFSVAATVRAANSIELRNINVLAFNDAACTNPTGMLAVSSLGVYEFAALAAGTIIGSKQGVMIVPSPTIYLQFTDDVGNQGGVTYNIRGYFD